MTERFVTSGDRTLWTASSGHGTPIILCPGGPGCCDYLAPIAELIDDESYVIRYDPRGCGRSTLAPPYTVATSLADLELIREQYGIDRWIVAGHSWGADLALIYALHYPQRVTGCICIAGGRIVNDREWHRIYSEQRDQGLEPDLPFAYPPNLDVNAELGRSWKAYIQRPSLLKELSQLPCPTLFVYGEQDIRPRWPVEQVAALLPQAHWTLIRGANHYIWTTNAHELKNTIRAFMIEQAQV